MRPKSLEVQCASLLALDGLGLGAEVGGGGARALEEAGKERLDKGVEDNGGATSGTCKVCGQV